MTDLRKAAQDAPETLAEALYRYGTDFQCHAASRGIADIEEAGCLMVEASKRLAGPAGQPVAWMIDVDESALYFQGRRVARLEHGTSNDEWREACAMGQKMVDKLNTAPQPAKPAEREPLTDEEITAVAFTQHGCPQGSIGSVMFRKGVRFAESALGINKDWT